MLSGSRRGFAQHDIDGANHILHVDDFILVGISSRKVERLVVIFAEGIENGGLQVGGIDARCKVGIALLERYTSASRLLPSMLWPQSLLSLRL